MDEKPVVIHVDMAEKRSDLPEYDQMAPCPYCGGEQESGFGLGGGGFGPYTYCSACKRITSKSVADE